MCWVVRMHLLGLGLGGHTAVLPDFQVLRPQSPAFHWLGGLGTSLPFSGCPSPHVRVLPAHKVPGAAARSLALWMPALWRDERLTHSTDSGALESGLPSLGHGPGTRLGSLAQRSAMSSVKGQTVTILGFAAAQSLSQLLGSAVAAGKQARSINERA